MGTKSAAAGGEIIQVQGGHIVRATGRKDRHSKVYTAKGPRDRRVRLSAHTAIQFYDVQDRLGYDRPSKAVDWLIKKAKSAIDKLLADEQTQVDRPFDQNNFVEAQPNPRLSADVPVNYQEQQRSDSSEYSLHITRQLGRVHEHHFNQEGQHQRDFPSSFLGSGSSSQPLDADAMKSLFPITSNSSTVNPHPYPRNHHMMSRNISTNQDLGLSLRSFQGNSSHPTQTDNQSFFPASSTFEASFRNLSGWNSEAGTEGRGFAFTHQPFMVPTHLADQPSTATFLNIAQRGTLQSSFSHPSRGWGGLPIETVDHLNNKGTEIHHGSSSFGGRFGLEGFGVPARIHGIAPDRPSSSPRSSSH